MKLTDKNPTQRAARAISVALVAIFLCLGAAPGAYGQAETPQGGRVVGYLTNWSYAEYKSMDLSALTHLNIAFCNPDAQGNLGHGFGSDQIFRDIVATAQAQGVLVMASLGGWGGHAHYQELTSPARREDFNDKIMAFIALYGLDGIDIDIEGDAPQGYWDHAEAWILSLSRRCQSENLTLSKTVSTWYSDKITDKAFAAFDFVNVMAYDGDHSDHSPYSLAENMLLHLSKERGIAKDKLVLGVPFYGFRGTKAISYKAILASYPEAWRADSAGGVTYNGIATIQRKCYLAQQYGGIMIWELSMDAQGEHSLLAAIKAIMR